MSIMIKIAWRNIWRNPRRSGVLITAIAVGVFSFLGALGYIDGFSIQMINAALDLQGGHVQISAAGYHDNPSIRSSLSSVDEVERVLAEMPGVRSAPLIASPGMINSTEQAAGVQISGVDAQRESGVTSIASLIIEGEYLSEDGDPTDLVLGEALAEQLNVRQGEKVVLMVNDLDNEVSAGAYRIVGLFRSNSFDFDKTNVYLHLDAARDLVGYAPKQVSLYTLRLDPDRTLEATTQHLQTRLEGQGLEVLTWRDRSPLLVIMRDMYDYASLILVVILFSAIAFTIVNSFLMVIFERIHEIGIMSANGVKPRQIRSMLYLEAFFIVLLGSALGGALAALLLWYWQRVGLDLSAFAEGLRSFGVSSIVYPYVDWGHILLGFVAIFVMVLLAVLYPAVKASRFETVEAINYV